MLLRKETTNNLVQVLSGISRKSKHLLLFPVQYFKMNAFLLSAAGMITLCSAFSITERSCRHFSVWQPSTGSLNRIHQREQCLDYRHFQSTELWSTSALASSNGDLSPGIAVIDDANDSIFGYMSNLQDSPYFRLFCVDILASCEYMPQELFECYSETCEVYPVDDDEVCFFGMNE